MRNLLIFCAFLFTYTTQAQVTFKKIRLATAIEEAAKTGKLVFVQFVSATCQQCNEVASVALANQALGNHINSKFITIEINTEHADRQVFIDTYNPTQQIGTYFIAGSGELVHRFSKTTTLPAAYLAEADKAEKAVVEGQASLAELNNEWKEAPTNVMAMQKNLERRMAMGLPTDSLLEEYVERLPKDQLNNKEALVFIANLAPNLFSQANKLLRQNNQLFMQAWYSIPLAQRVNINQRIIKKSMAEAINNKDKIKATQVAAFTAATYDNGQQKHKEYTKQLLDYAIGIKDTASYLVKAIDYYDDFYMIVPVNDIKRNDSLTKEQARQNAPMIKERDKDNPNIVRKKQTFQFSPSAQMFANSLNEGAWLLYTSSARPEHYAKALTWIERAMEFFDQSPEIMDTYARLLYVTGNKQKAIAMQQKAIVLLTDRKFDTARFEKVLQTMQQGGTLGN